LFFFFSSRRRHTRFSRDWSSDVCSSDLVEDLAVAPESESAQLSQRHGSAYGGNARERVGDLLRRSSWNHNPSREQRGASTWEKRSEEHTSELQSRENLVCRRLLEKNKQN